jgi:hypothetical protein
VEDDVLDVGGEEALRGEAERGSGVHVLPLELRCLRDEVVEVALLEHPRMLHGLAVGEHAPTLLHEHVQLLLHSCSTRATTRVRLTALEPRSRKWSGRLGAGGCRDASRGWNFDQNSMSLDGHPFHCPKEWSKKMVLRLEIA